jgi:signal transduction histidine kinase
VVSEDASKGSRILIVDDEEVNVALLQRMLSRAGYTRLTATTDSRDVVRLVTETEPDLILLDLMMPHVDGYEILAALASRQAEDYLPVMVLTADVTPQALQRALSAGARDFLTKPFDQTELLLRVRNLLETRHLYLGLQRQMQSLEQLHEDALQSIVFRDQTLSALSHDIAQPLTALRLTSDNLRTAIESAGADRSVVNEDVDLVIAATAQMTAMISELSDLARLQMGRELVLQKASVNLKALVEQQASAVRKSAGRRKVRVETPAQALVGTWDAMRLARVVSNLLSNAVRFTPASGEVRISLQQTSRDNEPWAELIVTDDGVGIPAAELPHVFERFYRASNVTGKIAGTGLGLASARQIVEQHGGSIEVTSELGAGTTLTVRLPL